MFLTKYRPALDLDSVFANEFLPGLKRWFDSDENEDDIFRLPRTNVNETDRDFVLTMEMPGVTKNDIDVSIERDQIVVTGERQEKVEKNGLLRREIRSAKFRRSFSLDASIDRNNIKARLEHGVLTVTLPKKAEVAGRKISID